MSELAILDLDGAHHDPVLVARVYESVLRPSFSSDELAGPEAVEPLDGRLLTVAIDGSGAPVAAAVTELEADGVSLLAYLAVTPAARGLGAGGLVMAHLRGVWQAAGHPLVLAEVHDPRGHAEAENERPEARLRFYQRAGAEVLDVPWIQPSLEPSGDRVPDMLLLAVHRTPVAVGPDDESEGDPATIPSAPLLRWAREYFIAAEGAEPSDPQAIALLDRLAARDLIRVLPLDRWRQVIPLFPGPA